MRTWVYPLHAVWVCVAIAHAQAVVYSAIPLEIVASPAGVGDDCVCGDEGGGEEGEEGEGGEGTAEHDGEEVVKEVEVFWPRLSSGW